MRPKTNTDKRAKRKSHTNETPEDVSNDVTLICERRRQEIFELVCKENELNQERKEKSVSNKSGKNFLNGISSDSDEELSNEDRRNLHAFRLNQKMIARRNCVVVPRRKVNQALLLLRPSLRSLKCKLTMEEKQLSYLKKYCTTNSSSLRWPYNCEHSWGSPMYIVKAIRGCLLTRNWNNLTQLLLMLLRHKKTYVSYVKQVAQLNLMNNPADDGGEILEAFSNLLALDMDKKKK